jgi:hypothetical protein
MSKQTESPASHIPSILRELQADRRNGLPIALTVNGRRTFVVEHDSLCERVLDLIDQLETDEAIRSGLKDVEEGRVRPFEDFVREKREKYGLPD